MTLAAGTKLGPYEILSPLGAGGMGDRRSADSEVWLRHRRAARGRRSTARLTSSLRFAPAARTSSSFGRETIRAANDRESAMK